MGLINFIKPTSLTLKRRRPEAGNAYTYIFQPDSKLVWKAGQHGLIELKLENGKNARRMFSLSSAPSEHEVHITTYWFKGKSSEFKKALHNLKTGDKAKIRGPMGPLYVRDHNLTNVFIAGGIGITPYRSIILEAANNNVDLKGVLLYVNKDKNIAFKNELENLIRKLPNLEIKYFIGSDKISQKDIKSIKGISKTFFISGSPGMVSSMQKEIKNLNKSTTVITDKFRGYKK